MAFSNRRPHLRGGGRQPVAGYPDIAGPPCGFGVETKTTLRTRYVSANQTYTLEDLSTQLSTQGLCRFLLPPGSAIALYDRFCINGSELSTHPSGIRIGTDLS